MALNVPLWVFDVDRGRILWANDAAKDLWHADSFAELYQRDMRADMSVSVAGRLESYKAKFEKEDTSFKELWTLYPNGAPSDLSAPDAWP